MTQPRSRVKVETVGLATALVCWVPALAIEVVEWHTCGFPWKQTPTLLFLLPPVFNPLNAKLNPICHLLALLGAHHILHISRVRVNTLVFYHYHLCTFRAHSCLSRVDHERKIRSRRQRTDIGKYSFMNRTIQHWNLLLAEVLGTLPCKPIIFKKRVTKVIIEVS